MIEKNNIVIHILSADNMCDHVSVHVAPLIHAGGRQIVQVNAFILQHCRTNKMHTETMTISTSNYVTQNKESLELASSLKQLKSSRLVANW